MKTKIVSAAAVCAAFFMAPAAGFANDRAAQPLVLAKETVPTFAAEDFPWGLPEGRSEDVSVPLGEAVLTMPWMEVEKDGDDQVTITAPEVIISKEEDGETEVGLQLEATEMTIRRLGDAMAASGIAEKLAIGGEGDVRLTAKGFEFAFTSSDYALTIEAMKADVKSGSDQMIEAMQALNFSLDYSAMSSSFVTFNGLEFEMSTGPSETGIFFGDGRLDISAESTKNVFAVSGPIPVDGEIGSLSYGFSMPTEASKAAQPMNFDFDVTEVSLSDTIWNLADPKKIFPRALDRAKLDMAMDVVLKQSIFKNTTRGGGAESLEPVSGSLTTLEFDGLGLDVSANGDIEMDGEIPKDVSAYASIVGLSEFMKNVVKAGFVPQSQAILGEGVALQFGTEEADGSLTFDVKTEDGVIVINGNRVAPLPQ